MVVEELKKKFETEKEVKFKLYSLEYIIKEEDAYAFLDNITLNKNNSFLLRNDKNKKLLIKK